MQFDGSSSSFGSGVGVVLISPSDEKFPKAYKLEFDTTNNTIEYEALLLGLEFAKEKGIKKLQVTGDVELIVNQVKIKYLSKNKRLRSYRNKVWDEIEGFVSFSIQAIPREKSTKIDSLVVLASLLLPHPEFDRSVYVVEMINRPSVPDNNQNWQVFDDDKHIISFLEGREKFSNLSFDGNSPSTSQKTTKEEEKEPEILQVKGNTIPKGLLSLKSLFNKHDQFMKKKSEHKSSGSSEVEKIDIGFENDPKVVLLGKCLTQKERKEIGLSKRASWIVKVQEYDIDIKPTKLVRGTIDEWFTNIAYFLTYGECLAYLTSKEKRAVKLKAAKYIIWGDVLYKKGIDGTFLRCVDKEKREKLLKFFQNEACGGHFSSSVMTYKMLRNCYYWPGIIKDADEWVKKCDTCQQFKGKVQLPALLLKPVIIEEPFQQWGLDFIGPIHPHSSANHTYILLDMDYFSKWVEVALVKQTTSEVVCDFIKKNLLVRYGVPHNIVTDNATNFSSHEISAFCYKYGIILSHASDYYPQGNGQAKASNKNIITILQKLVDENQRTWHKHLYEALWADHTTKKRAIRLSPFEIVYGTKAKLPIPLELSFLKLQDVLENYEFKDAL
ncbi:uncharacterized protein LOC131875353 [Cryptomeria japonica]|uniref:uncharacterized protein LOC131875353 n=1 Tax=Cryptomeria japonica TaxID=3369 RepID=UPI0027D9DB68|nr:uncharacterized protein LOC131875353 [Cryptomeria japonica]